MKSTERGTFINNDTAGYSEFLRIREKKSEQNRRIDRLELAIQELQKRISTLERVKEQSDVTTSP